MRSTAFFRREHGRLNELASRLCAIKPLEFDSAGVFQLVGLLTLRLERHVYAEAAELGPYLMHHPDAAVRVRAARFTAQTAAFLRYLRAFATRWPDREIIGSAPVTFLAEAQAVQSALRCHLRDEGIELYDMIDELSETSTARPGSFSV